MKKYFLLLCSVLVFTGFAQQKFYVNLNDRADDLFKVTVYPDNLSPENNIFHFAATAPGMYQIIDAGRYVRSFKAFDKNNNEVETEKISTNQFKLSNPESIERIEYTIAETWDTPVEENFIYEMGGTSIEDDNVVINGFLVFGYFDGRQADPVYIKIDYPQDWIAGTALKQNEEGYFTADNFDHLVDSPFMIGELSTASVTIDNTIIDIFTYSKTGKVESSDIMKSVEDIFYALNDFVDDMPIDRYVFLFHFEDKSLGALEHYYSSFYVYKESEFNGRLEKSIRDVTAHEIYHMITPLNLHSEIIEQFNFSDPVLSQHLWLYEGATEWASNILQLRAGLVSLDDHLLTLRKKMLYNDMYDKSISLKELALNSFELQPQFQIVYQRGAMVMELLDIKLLQLSNGKRGLREVINELADKYGSDKGFDEDNFFSEFVDFTFPEVENFIDKYIIGTQPLPLKEYFDLIGINYSEFNGYDSSKISIDFGIGVEGDRLIITTVPEKSELETGDIILKMNGEEISLSNYRKFFAGIHLMKVGDDFTLTVKRGDEEKEVNMILGPAPVKHIFEINENASPAQLELREAWLNDI